MPNQPPTVSVIMAAYNHGPFVTEAIRSVCGQTFGDLELIVVDDASTDDTPDGIRAFDDPRVTMVFHARNQGVIVSRREAFGRARGKYIAILNSDDSFHPEKLERQVAFLDSHPRHGAVFSDAMIIDDDGLPLEDVNHFYHHIFSQPNRTRHEWLRRFFFNGNCLCIPSVLMRRDCYVAAGQQDRRLTQVSDLDLWIRMCLACEIHVLEEKLVNFRVRSGNQNLSAPKPETTRRATWENTKVLERYLAIRDENELVKIFPEIQAHIHPDHPLGTCGIHYLLAKLALKKKHSPHHREFARHTLFSVLESAENAARLEARFGFTYKDFTTLTGEA